ncbi:GIY-YIG nuclease family protein [Gordonia sp. NPDC003950]
MNGLGPDLQGETEAAAAGAVPGYIYVLSSPNCGSLKIGRTDRLPPHRLKEINANPVYREHGPWSIVQAAQVTDTVAAETHIHRKIRSLANATISGQKELFDVSITEACKLIRQTPNHVELTAYPKLERCFFDPRLAEYLDKLYGLPGMSNFIDDQGAWTLSLFTGTAGGRFFTVNIGPHEVAYSSTPRRGEVVHENFLMVDRLILDFPEVRKWVRKHGGSVSNVHYESQRDRATGITFHGTFADALELLALPGVRRSLIAYWTEGLLEMRENGKESRYRSSHQWNAVAELQRRAEGLPTLFG